MALHSFSIEVEVDLSNYTVEEITSKVEECGNRIFEACIDVDNVDTVGCGLSNGEVVFSFIVEAPSLVDAIVLASDRMRVAEIGGL